MYTFKECTFKTSFQLKIWNRILHPRKFWGSRIKSLVSRIEMRVTVNLLWAVPYFIIFFSLQLYCLWNQGYFPRIISTVEDNIIIFIGTNKHARVSWGLRSFCTQVNTHLSPFAPNFEQFIPSFNFILTHFCLNHYLSFS